MIKNQKTRTKNQFIVEADPANLGEQPQVYQVSELTRDIKAILEAAFDSIRDSDSVNPRN